MSIKPFFNYSRKKKLIFEDHRSQCLLNPNVKLVIIGDSIVANFARQYPDMWEGDFPHAINLGISGDRIENVWWRILNGIPTSAQHIIIHVGTNNVRSGSADAIIRGLLDMVRDAIRIFPKATIHLSSILPRFD